MKWRRKINGNKSKIVHFRIKGREESKFIQMLLLSRYKYLGVVLDSSLDFDVIASFLAENTGGGGLLAL